MLPRFCLRFFAVGSAALLLSMGSVPAVARSDDDSPPQEKPNPLELTGPDPLLYIPPVDRPLTPFERRRLRDNADGLVGEAHFQYDVGNVDTAFEIWYRSLRLRRFLGPAEEIPALGDVGAIAWEAGARTFDIQVISDRLVAIERELLAEGDLESETTPESELWRPLAEAYEQLRLSDRAVAAYEAVLPAALPEERDDVLLKIAQLNQDRFAYLEAAAAYEELLAGAAARGDRIAQSRYLQELNELYALASEPENSLLAKEKLLAQYEATANPDDPEDPSMKKIPALLVGIGDDYAALERTDAAEISYQDAYQRALALEQFYIASNALDRLGVLYASDDRTGQAIDTYTDLIAVQQRSLDRFGSIQTYERLAELYLEQDDPERALAALERALELSETLDYDPERFIEKVEFVRDLLYSVDSPETL